MGIISRFDSNSQTTRFVELSLIIHQKNSTLLYFFDNNFSIRKIMDSRLVQKLLWNRSTTTLVVKIFVNCFLYLCKKKLLQLQSFNVPSQSTHKFIFNKVSSLK